jgi:hypothetical protein
VLDGDGVAADDEPTGDWDGLEVGEPSIGAVDICVSVWIDCSFMMSLMLAGGCTTAANIL